jgi:hypothetical protein
LCAGIARPWHRLEPRIGDDHPVGAAEIAAYTGFILVPLGHGTTIQPACAALSGLILASLILHEKPTFQRILGGRLSLLVC